MTSTNFLKIDEFHDSYISNFQSKLPYVSRKTLWNVWNLCEYRIWHDPELISRKLGRSRNIKLGPNFQWLQWFFLLEMQDCGRIKQKWLLKPRVQRVERMFRKWVEYSHSNWTRNKDGMWSFGIFLYYAFRARWFLGTCEFLRYIGLSVMHWWSCF